VYHLRYDQTRSEIADVLRRMQFHSVVEKSQGAPLMRRARRLWRWRGLLAGGVAPAFGGSLRGSSRTGAASFSPARCQRDSVPCVVEDEVTISLQRRIAGLQGP
jgi:hypothetical protein